MNRKEIQQHNQKVIEQVCAMLRLKLNTPYRSRIKMGYKELAANLNAMQLLSSRGKLWTFRALYRMMQRQQVALYRLECVLCQ
ncbi:hypothetical protein DU000_02425 [Parvibium lacunae]|uniref:Uncharacterized protein n=1 Tax=Parvibium lacunae TaxID=1888893 RepID=A0A368L7K4_9BURK|nr:hypothetical protein DU000_02425 [Parvibium lacunae]